MQSLDVIVHAVSLASATSHSYELRAAPGAAALPSFEAGAHIDVRLGPSLVRPYSLCNSPRETGRYLICVRRDDTGRGGSRTLHRDLHVGRRLRISPPRNHFPLVAARRHVLVAGGIGITPLLSMAEALAAREAPFVLHHYTSSAADAPLLERLVASAFAERTVVHHSDRGDTVRTGLPAELLAPDPDTAVYVCGPDGFMTHVTAEATAAGWLPGQIHTERFAPATPATPTAAGAEVTTEAATEFTVRIASTGIGYPVPADRTIADVLTSGGVEVELSCEQGICGACLTPVLAGEPDHRDEVRTPEERAADDRITICCSRSRTPELLLDL
ncbi:PDR/VanB family oxidoreductase [Streptomyces graminilatus]|uniref:PDR/VanB family oxidoreductase n=1 Tax=Streptomyces graminilatus TaxID=1464070 RepID=UPI0006E15831|nr:PDR/VanB family oxidoreductase [Streptomyces graminilatus]